MDFKEWFTLNEAAADEKYAFRAVFMSGGPGSGKTYLRDKIFGGVHFRIADSDKIQETFAKNKNASLAPFGRDYERSRELNLKRSNVWADSGYPIVIDITGRDINLVYSLNNKLISNGYDTGMVFVYADLNAALNRNDTRERRVDPEFLKQAWSDAQENVSKYKALFRERFVFLDNTNSINDPALFNKVLNRVAGQPYQILNPKGREIVRSQKQALVKI